MDIYEIRLNNLEQLISSYSTATKFADKVGISPSQLSQTRNPKYTRKVGSKVAREIERSLGLEYGWLDKSHSKSIEFKKETPPSYPIPILNTIQAGGFTEINQDAMSLEYDLVTPDLKDCFALKIIGDSMQPTLSEGMIAYVKPCPTANNGDIVIAQINNDTEATVKRFRKDAGTVYLVPDNDKYDSIKITKTQACRIIGIVVSAKINF